jgi:hypothetical protein
MNDMGNCYPNFETSRNSPRAIDGIFGNLLKPESRYAIAY